MRKKLDKPYLELASKGCFLDSPATGIRPAQDASPKTASEEEGPVPGFDCPHSHLRDCFTSQQGQAFDFQNGLLVLNAKNNSVIVLQLCPQDTDLNFLVWQNINYNEVFQLQ